MDKIRCKAVWQAAGLPVAAHCLVTAHSDGDQVIEQVGLPLVVKPVHEGSSVGVTVVRNRSVLEAALTTARSYSTEAMAEAFIDGAEYTVAMVAGQVLPLIRVETPHGFYDYSAKYQSDSTRYHCPCGLPAGEERALQALALRAFAAVQVSGWGRLDFFRRSDGSVVLLEINTAPGMTAHSLVPISAAAKGWDFKRLVWEILASTVLEGVKADG